MNTSVRRDQDTHWDGFFNLSGIAASLMLIYSLVTMIFLIVIGGTPETAQEGFALLAESRLLGLLRLDILTIMAMPLYYVLFLALYRALQSIDGAKSLLALVLGLAGVTLILASPSVFSFLALSDRFAAATDETQRTLLLAGGEAMLAADMWHSSGGVIGGLLLQTGALLISFIMLRATTFAKATAWVGIVTHGLDLLHILAGFFLPAAGTALLMIGGPLYLIWFPLLARDFWRIASTGYGSDAVRAVR
jgi:hypothetical protein